MYELLTGRVPFPGEGFGEILVAHLTKTPDPPSSINPDIRPEIEALVMHAIEKDKKGVLRRAEKLRQAEKKQSTSQVVAHLVGRIVEKRAPEPLRVGDRTVGSWRRDDKGRAVITLDAHVDDVAMERIASGLSEILAERVET